MALGWTMPSMTISARAGYGRVARRREDRDVDVVPVAVVGVNRRGVGLDHHGRRRARELAPAALDQVHRAESGRLADGEREAVDARADDVPQRPESTGAPFDVLEQWGGGADRLMRHVGDGAHFFVPVDRLADPGDLADGLGPGEPLAEIARRRGLGPTG